MPSVQFAKNIASIFGYNDLKEETKYDIISRLVCKTFSALSTSILIYDSKFDYLITRGSYISRQYFKKSTKNRKYEDVIMNIPVLEYFDNYAIPAVSRLLLNDFKTYMKNIDSEKIEISEQEFEELKIKWVSERLNKKYESYKQNLRNESHKVGGNTFSGKYFENLLKNKTQLTSEVEVKFISHDNELSKKYFILLEKMGIGCKGNRFIYIGAPLFATERYSGILRIILEDTHEIVQTELKSIPYGNISLNEKYHERINSFSQIISLNLKTNFYLVCFRELSKLQIDLNEDLKIDLAELDRVCTTITKILNCNGCLIRVKEDQKSSDSPNIRGISESLKEYSHYIANNPKSSFSVDITRLFNNARHNNAKLEALSFSIDKSDGDSFETLEYFYNKSGKLRYKTIPQRKFRDFTPEYKLVLNKLSMVRISVVPLMHFENSFIVFTNTKNRTFAISDIEVMLLASQRIGLEIKHTQETKRRNEEEFHEVIQGNVRIIEHQVGQMVKSSHDCIEQILHKNNLVKKRKFEEDEVDYKEIELIIERLKLLKFLIKQAKSQILKRAGIDKIENNSVVLRQDIIEDLWKYLKNKCLDFEPYAYIERNLHVWLTNQEERNVRLSTDSELLSEVLNNLIDNAIKYSFEAEEMKKKGVVHDEYNYRSEGNVLVSYQIDISKIKIIVSNWGYTIPSSEHDSIFRKNIRGSNSSLVVGSGLGLYYVKVIMKILNGEINIESEKNKTSFVITLNR